MKKLRALKPYIAAILAGLGLSILGLTLYSFISSGGSLETLKNSIPKIYVVQSGSMEPAIKTGSVVFSLPSETYSSGDIVTFRQGGRGSKLITHRINFKLYPDGVNSSPTYLTSGDANEDLDRNELKEEQIVGKLLFSVPYAGYAVDFAKKPYGFILLVIVPATIIIYEEIKLLFKEFGNLLFKLRKKLSRGRTSKKFRNDGQIRNHSIPKSSILVPVFGAGLVLVSLTASYFTDIETSVGNIFQAAESFEENGNGDPELFNGNPSCTGLGYRFGFKIDESELDNETYTLTSADGELTGGAPEDPNNSITISNLETNDEGEPTVFDWEATLGMDAVLVKAANNGNLYAYDPEAFSDTNLHAPVNPNNPQGNFFGISHIEFCYDYDVSINELIPNPSGADPGSEWIELFNYGVVTQNLDNWTISDTVGVTDTFDLTGKSIGAGAYLVIENAESGITLNNSSDGLELEFAGSLIIDSVSYASDPGTNVSIGRDPDGTGPFGACTTSSKGTSNTGVCQP